MEKEDIVLKNGDCLELMKELPDKSIDLFICDLPYGETNLVWDSMIDMKEFWKQFKRLRKSRRVACIHFCSTKFGYTLIKSWEKGFKMDMVLKKRQKTCGIQAQFRPMRNHEMVYFFYDQAPKYNRDKYHTKRLKKEHTDIEDNQKTPSNPISIVKETDAYCETKEERNIRKKNDVIYDPPNPASVFESTKVFTGRRHHQTEKPLDILEFFLKYWSDENDTILDPTMGSGTTGVACKKMKRKFIGYEKEEKIFEVAKTRINK